MSAVLKYMLHVGANRFHLPADAEVLHVAQQQGEAHVWILHPQSSAPTVDRLLVVVGTGWDLTESGLPMPNKRYVGTAHCGSLVWHVFEVVDPARFIVEAVR